VRVTRARNPANDTIRHGETKTRDTRATAGLGSVTTPRALRFQTVIHLPAGIRTTGALRHYVSGSSVKSKREKINIPRGGTHCLVGADSWRVYIVAEARSLRERN
jgi:hypothetical protein